MSESAATNPTAVTRTAMWSSTGSGRGLPIVPGYELLDRLGKGGMGEVWRARHLQLNRVVAVKLLLPSASADEQELSRFRNEANALAQLGHPNIVGVYDVGFGPDGPYLVLEYVDGGTLAERIHRRPQSPGWVAATLEKIARAADAAHRAGLIHRDLKPANVLLTRDGVPKITDFGLARRVDSAAAMTRTGVVVGTLLYMAPEQAEGHRLTPAADIYALGAILYEMLTGRPPFLAEESLEMLVLLMSEEPVPPRRLLPSVPAELETICLKCLSKEPANRYQSAAALAEDLLRFRERRPILARPVGRVRKLGLWARRNPAVAGLSAALVVVFLAAFAAVSAALYRASADRDLAREEGARAESQRADAERQKTIADAQRLAAEEQREIAEQQRAIAEQQRAIAEQQKTIAEQQRAKARAAVTVSRRHLYAADMTLAWQALHNGRIGRAEEILARQIPEPGRADDEVPSQDLRGFEWSALRSACRPETVRLSVPDSPAAMLAGAWSPDGRRLAVLDDAGRLQLWDATVSPPQLSVRARPDRREQRGVSLWSPIAAAFSPDGRWFAASVAERQVHLWDLSQPNATAVTLPLKGMVAGLAFSADGRRLMTADQTHQLNHWPMPPRAELGSAPQPTVRQSIGNVNTFRLRLSGDLTQMVGCGERTGQLWSWKLDPLGRAAPVGPAALPLNLAEFNDANTMLDVAVTRDGGRAGVVIQNHDRVLMFDLANGVALPALALRSAVSRATCLDFSPDGKLLAVGRGMSNQPGVVELINLATGQVVRELRGHADGLASVAFSPDGASLLSCSADGTARVWPVKSDSANWAGPLGQRATCPQVAFDAAGRYLLVALPGAVVVLEAATLRELGGAALADVSPRDVRAVAFSPEGRRGALGLASGTVVLLDWSNAAGIKQQRLACAPAGVVSVAFAPDGQTLAAGGQDESRLWLWRTSDGAELPAPDFRDLATAKSSGFQITDLAWSPDGRRLLAATGSRWVNQVGLLMLWEVGRWSSRLDFAVHPGRINSVAFLPSGRAVATGCFDTHVRICEIPSSAAPQGSIRVLQGHLGSVSRVAASPDGARLATADRGSSEVKLWDAADGRELATLLHNGSVLSLAWSPDGRALAVGLGSSLANGSTSAAGGLQVWRAAPLR